MRILDSRRHELAAVHCLVEFRECCRAGGRPRGPQHEFRQLRARERRMHRAGQPARGHDQHAVAQQDAMDLGIAVDRASARD